MMLRTTNPQRSLWEAILPDACLGLPAELARVDRLLDDPVFLAPLTGHFDPRIGRPSIPLDTYLRIMFLKFRYGLGYELVCREVQDSICWQRFCRIPLGGQVPHPTTLVKLTRRLGEQAVRGLNQALLAKAAEHKVLRTHRVRVDTTVVGANVAYPTDAGLLTRAIGKLQRTIQRIQAAGGASRTRARDRRRAARRRAHQLAKTLRCRSEQAKDAVLRTIGELSCLAEQAITDAAGSPAMHAVRAPVPTPAPPGGLGAWSATWTPPSGEPPGSSPRPACGWLARFPRGPAGWSACTTPTPARSSKGGSASRSSLATRRRWPTTLTGWCSIIRSRSATRWTRRSWPRRSSGSRPGRAGFPGR
jgi:IS5 family transposase